MQKKIIITVIVRKEKLSDGISESLFGDLNAQCPHSYMLDKRLIKVCG